MNSEHAVTYGGACGCNTCNTSHMCLWIMTPALKKCQGLLRIKRVKIMLMKTEENTECGQTKPNIHFWCEEPSVISFTDCRYNDIT